MGVVATVFSYRAYRYVQRRVEFPAVPATMAQVEIPADVDLIGEAILDVYANDLVLSGDESLAITSVEPKEGPPGTEVVVSGAGFGDSHGNSQVMINSVEAVAKVEVLEWTDTKIRFLVPVQSTTGDVNVVRWDYIRTERTPKGSFRPIAKNPRASNGIPFTVLGQEENIALGKSIFFGWTQLNEEASSLLRIPRLKIGTDPYKWEKYGFLPRVGEVDEGDSARFSRATTIVGVRMQQGLDGEYRIGYSCAFCHTGRDPATGLITPGLSSSTLQFGKLIATAPNLPEDMRKQALNWPPGTSDLTFRYFPDNVENPTAIMQNRGVRGLRYWASGGIAMPEYERHSNAWLMQGAPYMAPLKVSIALSVYLATLHAVKNPKVDKMVVARGLQVFRENRCDLCHTPAMGLYTNQRVFPFEAMGSNGPPTSRMKDTGGIRVAPLMSVYATAPYLHDHSVASLDDLFDPARLVVGSPIYRKPFTKGPSHPWVIKDVQKRKDLIEFVNSL